MSFVPGGWDEVAPPGRVACGAAVDHGSAAVLAPGAVEGAHAVGQHVQHSGDDVPASGPLVMQADRFQWQRAAARELATILEEHPGLPAVT